MTYQNEAAIPFLRHWPKLDASRRFLKWNSRLASPIGGPRITLPGDKPVCVGLLFGKNRHVRRGESNADRRSEQLSSTPVTDSVHQCLKKALHVRLNICVV